MYYEIYGKGEPLLLIHGNGASMNAFKYQIDFFAKKYKVIGVDSRAQGKTVDTSSVLNYEMMADDLNAFLDSLKIDSANVIGWSDGGINGLLLAIRHPKKVKKLVATGANLVPVSMSDMFSAISTCMVASPGTITSYPAPPARSLAIIVSMLSKLSIWTLTPNSFSNFATMSGGVYSPQE